MNINNKLIAFAQQELVLSHNEAERERINSSIGQLEKILRDRLGVKSFLRFGSYTRNTILPRKYDAHSDVDLMVIFGNSENRHTPGTYRKRLHDTLTSAYPYSLSKKDFPAVKLELNHIMFDVVPAVTEIGTWSGRTNYYIPDLRDGWRQTDPNDVNEKLQRENQRYGNNTVRNVIRLMKHWNASKNYPFESYLMEQDILNLSFYNEDTYSGFLTTLKNLAYYKVNGVSYAIDNIKNYQAGWFTDDNYTKQWQWLQRLLPGLQ